jgi:hypothetical protein
VDLIIPESANPVEALQQFAGDQFKRWSDACDQFLRWERASMLLATPSSEVARQHRAALLLLLRMTRALCEQAQITPVAPEGKAALTARLRQLQGCWNMFYDPIKESQPLPGAEPPPETE